MIMARILPGWERSKHGDCRIMTVAFKLPITWRFKEKAARLREPISWLWIMNATQPSDPTSLMSSLAQLTMMLPSQWSQRWRSIFHILFWLHYQKPGPFFVTRFVTTHSPWHGKQGTLKLDLPEKSLYQFTNRLLF